MLKTSRWETIIPTGQIVSYQTGENQFTILAIVDHDVSKPQAKEAARQKGAQMTLENGFRYFSIVSEDETQVVKTSSGANAQVPGNLYQELIVEKQFGRESLNQNQGGATITYPAVKLVI